jgi:hypothetical protein
MSFRARSPTYPATGSDWSLSIRREGVVREPLLESGCYPFIHEADLAAVAAAALLDDGYAGQILEAVGPPISTRSRISAIEAALGRRLATQSLTIQQGRDAWLERGWPGSAIQVTLYGLEAYAVRFEELAAWTLAQEPSVERLIGHPLVDYEQWAREHVEAFRPDDAQSPAAPSW